MKKAFFSIVAIISIAGTIAFAGNKQNKVIAKDRVCNKTENCVCAPCPNEPGCICMPCPNTPECVCTPMVSEKQDKQAITKVTQQKVCPDMPSCICSE